MNKLNLVVINGPNLNMLGRREPHIYGERTYQDLCDLILCYAEKKRVLIDIRQSNHEGDLVDWIQQSCGVDGIIINAAAYTHTSVAIHDALKAMCLPTVEVHISDINNREEFRKINYIRECCDKSIVGHGFEGYLEAIDYLIDRYEDIICE